MKIEFSTQKEISPKRAVEIDPRRDVNYYETLCAYCADNDVSLDDTSEEEFEEAVGEISHFGFGFEGPTKPFWFWIA